MQLELSANFTELALHDLLLPNHRGTATADGEAVRDDVKSDGTADLAEKMHQSGFILHVTPPFLSPSYPLL